MLTVKRPTGVEPEMNTEAHGGDEAHKQGILSNFETQGRCHQKSKTGVPLAQQKGLVSSKTQNKTKTKNKQIHWWLVK